MQSVDGTKMELRVLLNLNLIVCPTHKCPVLPIYLVDFFDFFFLHLVLCLCIHSEFFIGLIKNIHKQVGDSVFVWSNQYSFIEKDKVRCTLSNASTALSSAKAFTVLDICGSFHS